MAFFSQILQKKNRLQFFETILQEFIDMKKRYHNPMSGTKRFKTQMQEYGELEINMWFKFIAIKAAYDFYEIYLNWLIKRSGIELRGGGRYGLNMAKLTPFH